MHWAKFCQHKRAQNANIIETSDEEESGNEFEIEDVNFVLMTTQNPKVSFLDEMKTKILKVIGIPDSNEIMPRGFPSVQLTKEPDVGYTKLLS